MASKLRLARPTQSQGTAKSNTKGLGNLKSVDYDALSQSLSRLREKQELKMRTVEDDPSLASVKNDLVRVINAFHTTHETKAYEQVYKLIREKFGDVDKPIPGTIGGFVYGCASPTSTAGPSECTVVCAGALPSPSQGFCEYPVMWGMRTPQGNYSFNLLQKINGKNGKIILYVPETSLETFPGLSVAEKAEMAREGITHVNLMSYGSDYQTYKNLTSGDFVPLNDVKTRAGAAVQSGPSVSTPGTPAQQNVSPAVSGGTQGGSVFTGSNAIWWGILILIVIGLIIFFAARANNRSTQVQVTNARSTTAQPTLYTPPAQPPLL